MTGPDSQQAGDEVEVAVEFGINQSAVSDYKKGVVRIHAAMLAGLCKALKASADEILDLEKATKANAKAPERRFLLSRRDRQAILGTIDAFLSKVS